MAESQSEVELRKVSQFCNKLRVSIITWYILVLVAWAMFPYGLFDKEGLLDVKQWEFFLVCTSFGWFLWFGLSGHARTTDIKTTSHKCKT